MQKQVRVILMQGISLLQQVYRDIGLRPMNDMDLWVLPEQYNDLVDCFVSQGFEQNSIYPHTFSKGEVVVDIHTHILWGDRIRSRDSRPILRSVAKHRRHEAAAVPTIVGCKPRQNLSVEIDNEVFELPV